MKLKHPISLEDGKSLTEIILGKFKVKHLKLIPGELYELAVDKDRANSFKKNSSAFLKAEKAIIAKSTLLIPKLIPLLASLTGQTVEIMDELEIDDFLPLMEEMYTILGEVMSQTG